MKSALKEAKSTIQKSYGNMMRYYNQQHISDPVFRPSDKVFLDLLYIYTTSLSSKLLHCYLESYMIEKQVGPMLYHLKLSPILWILYLVFHVVKLSAILKIQYLNNIYASCQILLLSMEKENKKLRKILDNHQYYRKY